MDVQEILTAWIINVVNSGGEIYFIDSQIGKVVTLRPDVSVRLGNAP